MLKRTNVNSVRALILVWPYLTLVCPGLAQNPTSVSSNVSQGRQAEAQPLYKRAQAIVQSASPSGVPTAATKGSQEAAGRGPTEKESQQPARRQPRQRGSQVLLRPAKGWMLDRKTVLCELERGARSPRPSHRRIELSFDRFSFPT